MEIEKIRQAVRENKVIITYHARRQMGLRKVDPGGGDRSHLKW